MVHDPLIRGGQAQLAEILAATGPEGAYLIAEYLGLGLDAEDDESRHTKNRPRSTSTVGRGRLSYNEWEPPPDGTDRGRVPVGVEDPGQGRACLGPTQSVDVEAVVDLERL